MGIIYLITNLVNGKYYSELGPWSRLKMSETPQPSIGTGRFPDQFR